MGQKQRNQELGAVLIVTYFLLAALAALLAAYYKISEIELATTKHSKESVTGFYSAEAGLNLRAEDIRSIFVGYNRPSGTSPVAPVNPSDPNFCEGSNLGSGDFVCEALTINNREVTTYLIEDPANPVSLTIPPGELYQNLNAQEYRYTVRSTSQNIEGHKEALLELRFKSRLVPLFQFVAFYNKDLEILPGPVMNLSGPIHTNGDLYLNANNALNIAGQVSTAGDLYRGRKNDSSCNSTPVTILDPTVASSVYPSCPSRTLVTESYLGPWNGMAQVGVDVLTVPEPDALSAQPGEIYWDKADLRLVLRLDGSNNPITGANSTTGVYVYEANQVANLTETSTLHSCPGGISGRAIGYSNTFYNNREGAQIRLLEVDMLSLLNCLHNTSWLGGSKLLNDSTEGGIVFHFSVEGPHSAALPNTYGVRVRNTASLQSNIAGAPLVRGMSIVSDQAYYTHGNFNSVGKIPAAIMVDSFNVLSNNWNLNDAASSGSLNGRVATNTVINSAVLAGTDTTGGINGVGGQGGAYNGGLENYPRFHENWTGRTLSYRGSFVSLYEALHVNGGWIYGSPQYTAPNRDWDYDTDFNDAANLPPLTPRFVYLRQELFVRDFGQ